MAVLRLDEIARDAAGPLRGDVRPSLREFHASTPGWPLGRALFRRRRAARRPRLRRRRRGARGRRRGRQPIAVGPAAAFGLVQVRGHGAPPFRPWPRAPSPAPVQVVGITGSVGKTTTKELTAALLAGRFRGPQVRRQLQQLPRPGPVAAPALARRQRRRPRDGHERAGRDPALTGIAPPDVAVITNVQPGPSRVLRARWRISPRPRGGPRRGQARRRRPFSTATTRWSWRSRPASRTGERTLFFGRGDRAATSAPRRSCPTVSTASNSDCALRPGIRRTPSVRQRGCRWTTAGGRGRRLRLRMLWTRSSGHRRASKPVRERGPGRAGRRRRLIDDSYNSKPRALDAALRGLVALPPPAGSPILADMLELGEGERRSTPGRARPWPRPAGTSSSPSAPRRL